MPDDQAAIIVGASPVAADRRHTYVLFQRSDGSAIVVRGGPDARAEGNDLANLAGSTILGSDNFGHIRVDAATYIPPYIAVYQRQPDGSIRPLPANQTDPEDPSLIRNADGMPIEQREIAPDWPLPGEDHERIVVWKGTDEELESKMRSAITAGQQINDAQLEYSPLYNNSNGVTGLLLKASDVRPLLPLDKDGQKVDAPNFGERLFQDVGLASSRSGYSFDGKQWWDDEGRKIKPPQSGETNILLDPTEKGTRSGSFDSSYNVQLDEAQQTALATGDPDLDRLAAALLADDDTAISRVNAQIEQSQLVKAHEHWGRDLVAFEQSQELQQQEATRQALGPGMVR